MGGVISVRSGWHHHMSKEEWLRRSSGGGGRRLWRGKGREKGKREVSSCSGLFPKVNPMLSVSLANQQALWSVFLCMRPGRGSSIDCRALLLCHCLRYSGMSSDYKFVRHTHACTPSPTHTHKHTYTNTQANVLRICFQPTPIPQWTLPKAESPLYVVASVWLPQSLKVFADDCCDGSEWFL